MRSKIMGVDWWFDKLTKYRAVRRKMQQGGANVDLMAEIQMARFEGDRQKERRMKEREHAIRNEANPIRKVGGVGCVCGGGEVVCVCECVCVCVCVGVICVIDR